jgi:hypothetical protein
MNPAPGRIANHPGSQHPPQERFADPDANRVALPLDSENKFFRLKKP